MERNPSPGSHLKMRSDLSHKGRGAPTMWKQIDCRQTASTSRRMRGVVLGAASGGGLEADVAVDGDDEDGLAAGLAEIELKLGVELLRQRVDDAQAAAGPHVRRRGRPVVGDAAFDEFSRRPALDPDRAAPPTEGSPAALRDEPA